MKTTKLVLTIVVSLFSFSAILAQNHNHDHSKEGHKKMKMDAKKEYTCSMHPEVKSDKPGDCPKCGMKLIEKKEDKKMDKMVTLAAYNLVVNLYFNVNNKT